MTKSQKRAAARAPIAPILALGLFALTLVAACSRGQAGAPPVVTGGRHFLLDLVPGPAYHHALSILIFKVRLNPQIACWIESLDGKYLDTIYVTAKGANESWGPAAPAAGRPEALPVWSHARKQQSPPADAVSGATPKGGVTRARFSGSPHPTDAGPARIDSIALWTENDDV